MSTAILDTSVIKIASGYCERSTGVYNSLRIHVRFTCMYANTFEDVISSFLKLESIDKTYKRTCIGHSCVQGVKIDCTCNGEDLLVYPYSVSISKFSIRVCQLTSQSPSYLTLTLSLSTTTFDLDV